GLVGFTPETVSVMVPKTVTGTSLPLGGQRMDGLAETVIAGGLVSNEVLLSSTDTLSPFANSRSGFASAFTSAAATASAAPGRSYVIAGWKVPSPFPIRMLAAPKVLVQHATNSFARRRSGFLSPLTSATVTEFASYAPEAYMTVDWKVPSPLLSSTATPPSPLLSQLAKPHCAATRMSGL